MAKVRPLPEVLQKVAIEELNEDPQRLAADIQTLKTWIEQQPHLNARTDEQFLVAFLRGSKFSLEKAKSKIDQFYMMRSKYPELFTIRGMEEETILEIIKLGVMLVLPTPLNETGPRIIMVRNGCYDADKYDFLDIMRVSLIFNEICMLHDDYALVNGFVHVADLKGWTKKHFFQITPSLMKKMTVYTEESMPLRPKASHIINAPSIFESIFNILKLMMTEKQVNRMTIYSSNLDKMYDSVPQKYLPKEYGGENASIPEIIETSLNMYNEFKSYLDEDVQYGTDEKLRTGKPVDFENLFGLDGSFRKLTVD